MQSVGRTADGLEVRYDLKDKASSVAADKVLVAVGRRADLDAMNFRDIGLEMTPKGIVVDGNMQTNIPHIYATGDDPEGDCRGRQHADKYPSHLCHR